jgi:hypothetical protein
MHSNFRIGANLGAPPSLKFCHPERSVRFAKRSRHVVEGPYDHQSAGKLVGVLRLPRSSLP